MLKRMFVNGKSLMSTIQVSSLFYRKEKVFLFCEMLIALWTSWINRDVWTYHLHHRQSLNVKELGKTSSLQCLSVSLCWQTIGKLTVIILCHVLMCLGASSDIQCTISCSRQKGDVLSSFVPHPSLLLLAVAPSGICFDNTLIFVSWLKCFKFNPIKWSNQWHMSLVMLLLTWMLSSTQPFTSTVFFLYHFSVLISVHKPL